MTNHFDGRQRQPLARRLVVRRVMYSGGVRGGHAGRVTHRGTPQKYREAKYRPTVGIGVINKRDSK